MSYLKLKKKIYIYILNVFVCIIYIINIHNIILNVINRD